MEMELTIKQMTEFLKAMEEMMETQIGSLAAKWNAYQAKADTDHKEIKEDMKIMHGKIDTNRAEMKAMHEEMMAKLDAHHARMIACLGKTEAMDLAAIPEETESETEHKKVPKEHATVKPVGGLRKRHGGWNLAAKGHDQPEKRTQGNCGSRKQLTAAGRKVTRHAGMA
jgi:hypothetical protein